MYFEMDHDMIYWKKKKKEKKHHIIEQYDFQSFKKRKRSSTNVEFLCMNILNY